MDAFDLEIQQIFLEEGQQLLDDAEEAFLALDSGNHSSEHVDKIFRLAHNFKGSAKAAGFEPLSQFAHKMEDVLVKIRTGVLAPDKSVCTLLLRALDALKAIVAGLKANPQFSLDTSELENALREKNLASQQTTTEETHPEEPQHQELDARSELIESEILPQRTVAPSPTLSQPPTPTSSLSHSVPSEDFLRVSTTKLDELINLVGEMVVNQTVMNGHRSLGTIHTEHALQTLSYMNKIVSELQDKSMSLRMMPVKPLFQRMRRSLRDVADAQGKAIELITEGEHVEVDKTILDRITDPLNHLIRNAADHGIESTEKRLMIGKPEIAQVYLIAAHQEDHINITIRDDGAGLNRDVLIKKAVEKGLIGEGAVLTDQEAYSLIFKPGFSTKEQVTEISGRGVGMDVVLRAVEDLKGSIQIVTELGKGTSFIISLPLSLSIISGMVISVDHMNYVVPVSQLTETIEYQKLKIESVTGKGRMINLRGEILPVYSLSQILHGQKQRLKPLTSLNSVSSLPLPGSPLPGSPLSGSSLTKRPGVVTSYRGKKYSFEIDSIIGQQQVVLKKLGPEMNGLPGIIAGAVLGNGEPGLILNLHEFTDERFRNAS